MEGPQNLRKAEEFFREKLVLTGHHGVIGVTAFPKVYDSLIPVQKNWLKTFCGGRLDHLRRSGSMICIGVAYTKNAIDCIGAMLSDGTPDRDVWNVYAKEYHTLNRLLNNVSEGLANLLDGTPIPATVEGIKTLSIEEYYGRTISHRVVAENAGLGWRGKNQLIVNERFSCALRFASILIDVPLIQGVRVESKCGKCDACLRACPFLRNQDILKDYRESCRRYIAWLKLEGEVCGKCINACYRHSIISSRFRL